MIRRAASRAVADQGIWALSNFVLVVAVANTTSVSTFGLFGIAYGVLVVCAGLTAVVSGEALAVALGVRAQAGKDPNLPPEATATSRAIGATFAMAASTVVPVGLCIIVFGQSSHDGATWLLVVVSPIVVAAEGLRAILYAQRRSRVALSLAVTWAAVQAVLLGVAAVLDSLNPISAVLSWGMGALLSSLLAIRLLHARPEFRGSSRDEWSRRWQYGLDFVGTAGPTQLTVLIAGWMLGLDASAALRALQTMFGPLNILTAGVRRVLVPEKAMSPTGALRAGGVTAALATGAAVFGTVVLLAWPDIGVALLSGSWPRDENLLTGFAAGRCAVGIVVGALVVYRIYDLGAESLRLRQLSIVATVLPFVAGAVVDLSAAVWASASCSLLVALLWWVRLRRLASDGRVG